MKNLLIKVVFIFLAACMEPGEPEYDAFLYLINISKTDRIIGGYEIFTSDQTLNIGEFSFTKDPSFEDLSYDELVFSGDSLLIEGLIERSFSFLLEDTGGVLYYVINVDSLEQLPWKEVRDNHRGVTTYFFESYEELEAVDFRLIYPKEE